MLSVIVISYNTKETTLKCLESLGNSTFTDFEIVVVDNASTDGSAAAIKEKYPKIQLIQNSENVGFSKANNQAMKVAKGSMFVLLNSDAFVFFDTLQIMEHMLSHRPDVDIAGCQLLNKDGTIQPSWGFFPTLRRIGQMMFFIDNLPIIRDSIDSIHIRSDKRFWYQKKVDWVTGAFLMLKREVFEKSQGFDENFFMYGEEIEWLYRCKKLGFKTWYIPEACCVHLLGASSANRSPAIVGEMKGWIYWFGKHNKPWQVKTVAILAIIGSWLRVLVKPNLGVYYREAATYMQTQLTVKPVKKEEVTPS